MKNQNPMIVLILLIITILLSFAFISSVANTKAKQTSLLSSLDEQVNLQTIDCYNASGQVDEDSPNCNITVENWYSSGDWRINEPQCYLSNVVVTNDSGTALTEDTDYEVYEDSGIIHLLNTETTSNESSTMNNNIIDIDYSYCGEGYLTSGGDRSLANLWTLMMILVLLISISGVVFKMLKG